MMGDRRARERNSAGITCSRVALDFLTGWTRRSSPAVRFTPAICSRARTSCDQSFAQVRSEQTTRSAALRYSDLPAECGVRKHRCMSSWCRGDCGIAPDEVDSKRARIYHPLVPGGSYPVRMAVHTTGDPLLFASRLRSIARDVEPTLQISEIARFDQVAAAGARTMTLLFWSFLALAFVVVLLSLTGIYSVLSFTASQRTREVGIRIALGGRPRHVVAVLFRGPMTQIVLGILIGLVIADRISEGDMGRVIAVYGCAVVAISALATLGPVRRALRIQPIDALRAE